MKLTTLHESANVIIFGATGGIGRALVAGLATCDNIATIHAVSRNPLPHPDARVRSLPGNLEDEASIATAVAEATANAPLDLCIVATGVLHGGEAFQPEKAMRELKPEAMAAMLRINTIGPTLVAKHALPAMRRGHKTVFAALSARVGSIGDNRLGGWLSYRMSKAALNMALRTLSIEQSRRFPETVVVALHPGTVDTGLSKPFSSRVPSGQLFTPETSAKHLVKVIDALRLADTGGFFAWDGSVIDY